MRLLCCVSVLVQKVSDEGKTGIERQKGEVPPSDLNSPGPSSSACKCHQPVNGRRNISIQTLLSIH